MTKLAAITAGWPLAASLAALATARGLRVGRRRNAINEALHELRRPLQTIALAAGQEPAARDRIESSVQLAAAALEELDREINGGKPNERRELVRMRPVVESAIARSRARATMDGDALALSWRAGQAIVCGDRIRLSQALDNLIVNAVEHGGAEIVVDARVREGLLCISIADSGPCSRLGPRRRRRGHRHGHGLAVVRRIAAAHDGRFALRCGERGSLAALELPLAVAGAELAA